MSSRNSVAASVRKMKEARPSDFCPVPSCLWRIVRGDGSLNPCKNHPVKPAPAPTRTPATPLDATDPSTVTACTRCDARHVSRVEVFTATQRLIVCARCAVAMAREGTVRRIAAFAPAQASVFVTGMGFYSPRVADVAARQRAEEAAAERFAARVQRVIDQNGIARVA